MSGEGTSSLLKRRSLWFPWALVAVTGGFAAMEFVVGIQNNATNRQVPNAVVWLAAMVFFLLPLSFATVGAFIVTRRPGNRIGWLMIAVGLGFAVASFSTDYPRIDVATHRPTRPCAPFVAWVESWDWLLQLTALLLLLLLFPTGELPSRRWRPVMWIGVATLVGYGAMGAVARGPIENVPLDNPVGIVSVPDIVAGLGAFIALAALAAAALSLVVRFRTSGGVVRQQLKWFTFGASVAIPLNIATYFFTWNSVVGVCAILAELALPIFMGFAILRYRLYDIDVLINRTLVYGSLTASLAALYVGGVVSLQTLFHLVVGGGSDLAIAISTLAIAALFQPLRHRIQSLIDRRFYRRKYDAVQTLAAFQGRLRNEVDLEQLSGDLLGVVQETVQPTHASLWLRSEHGS